LKLITEDIYMLSVPLPFPATPEQSLYYIDGKNPVLIDTGLATDESIRHIEKKLNSINRSLSGLDRIINTHEHSEHFGGNSGIRDISGALITASSVTADIIEHYSDTINSIETGIEQSDAAPEVKKMLRRFIEFNRTVPDSPVDERVQEGSFIELDNSRFRVIHTPGHAHGHICLHDPDRKLLFSGDHIIATGSTFVGYGWRNMASGPITDLINSKDHDADNLSLYIDSVDKLKSLDLEMILPGHGGPITEPEDMLDEIVLRKLYREKTFRAVLDKNRDMSLEQLIKESYGQAATSYLHYAAALGYLVRMSREGILRAEKRHGEIWLVRT